ncbi:DUF1848 domain-containing protein [Desulfonatronum parangueonense]
MKPRIISASRRTDIPAFYSSWLMNRIRAGFCVYPNPLYPQQVYRVSLRSEDVLGIVFWTRNPAPFVHHLATLDKAGFVYYFQYTIVGYPRTIDLRSPSVENAVKTFSNISHHVGSNRVIWRYDPIILNHDLSLSWHHDNFRRIADSLIDLTHQVIVSVIDPYARTQRRVGTAYDGVLYNPDAYADVLRVIVDEATSRNLVVQSCAENSLLIEGIAPGSCVDSSLIYSLAGRESPRRLRFHKQREGCLCHESVDIGVNDSCGFGCKYCYATISHEKALETLRKHRHEWTCISKDIDIPPPDTSVQQRRLL